MKEYDAIAVGKRIAKRCAIKGVTQDALSEALGITPKHLSKVERGLHTLSAASMFYLSQILAVGTEYLYTGNPVQEINAAVQKLMENGSATQHKAVFDFLHRLIKGV